MPLVNDYNAVKDAYAEAAEKGIALPVFCAEDRETLEAILASIFQRLADGAAQQITRGETSDPEGLNRTAVDPLVDDSRGAATG